MNWLVKPKPEWDSYDRMKSQLLVIILLLIIVTCPILYVANWYFEAESSFPFFYVSLLFVSALLIYRQTTSMLMAGNFVAFVIAYVIFNMTLETGGLYSEDIQSSFIVPMIALVTAGLWSGLFWTIVSTAWAMYLYSICQSPDQISFYREQTFSFEPGYYLIISLFNIFIVMSVFAFFYYQNRDLVKKLKLKHNELQEKNDAIIGQTEQLRKAQEELNRSNEELEEYAHATSHDLKQPIRTINSFAQVLNKHLTENGSLDERSAKYLEFIIGGTENMSKLVSDLLEYAKLNSLKKEEKEKFCLNEILNSVLQNLHNLLEKNDVEIICDDLPKVCAIPVKINQVFQNLISNAVKFKKKEEQLILTIESKELKDSWQISVRDNGIGMKEENLEKIFAPFKKLHNDTEYSGSGIGLATCKRIIELHNGKIWAESQFGLGTSFYFTVEKEECMEEKKEIPKEIKPQELIV